jgi:hypothetical protein
MYMDYGKDAKPGLLFGDFKVEKFHDPDHPDHDDHIAYLVTGKRASYTLWRNKVNPRHLFVMGEPKCRPGKCRGYEWFYDAPCGRVIPMR